VSRYRHLQQREVDGRARTGDTSARSRPRHPGRLLSFCLVIDGSAAAVFPRLGSSIPSGRARGRRMSVESTTWLDASQLGNQSQEVVPPWIRTRASAVNERVRADEHRRASGWPSRPTMTTGGLLRIQTVTYRARFGKLDWDRFAEPGVGFLARSLTASWGCGRFITDQASCAISLPKLGDLRQERLSRGWRGNRVRGGSQRPTPSARFALI
jgi:hypothetical protein